jgi:hypothetical protein
MWTADGGGPPPSTNFFSYNPDCPSGNLNDGFAPDHWSYAVYKGCTNLRDQQAPIGLTDESNGTVIHPESNFQTTWWPSSIIPSQGWSVEMHVLPGVVPCNNAYQISFDLENAIAGGVVGLHSHHEILMTGSTGLFDVEDAIHFNYGADQYYLALVLPPHNTSGPQHGLPAGFNFVGCGICDGHHHDILLDGGYFGVPNLANDPSSWNTGFDIDWTYLLTTVQNAAQNHPKAASWVPWSYGTLNISNVANVKEVYESSGYGSPEGGVDTLQRNWLMYYPGQQTG